MADQFPTKLSASIFFWSEVYRIFSPIMAESQEQALAYAPELLKRGHVDPIEFFTTLMFNLDQLGRARDMPIYYAKRDEVKATLDKADVGTRLARYACCIADQYDPSISKAFDAKEVDRWQVVVAVANLLQLVASGKPIMKALLVGLDKTSFEVEVSGDLTRLDSLLYDPKDGGPIRLFAFDTLLVSRAPCSATGGEAPYVFREVDPSRVETVSR